MTGAVRLFRVFSLRHLWRRKLRYALAASSVALAVALFVSTRVTEASILASFDRSEAAMRGRADLIVTRGLGVPAAALPAIEAVEGVAAAAPVIQEATLAPDQRASVVVLGIDFVRDAALREYRFKDEAGLAAPTAELDPAVLLMVPDAVIVSRSFATRAGLGLRGSLPIETRAGLTSFTVAGILEDEGAAAAAAGHIVVTSVATAQRRFARGDRFDRIEVALADGVERDVVAGAIRAAIVGIVPPGADEAGRSASERAWEVRDVGGRNPMLDYIVAQQRTTFLGITILAMLIGVFIIFNTLSLSVVERVKDLGILRALGARRRDLVLALVIEAAFVGAVSSGAGALLGIVLAYGLIEQAARQIQLLVSTVDVSNVVVPPETIAIAMGIGVVTAVAGAAFPALQASSVPPMVAIRKTTYGQGLERGYLRSFVIGLGLFAVGAWLAIDPQGSITGVTLSLLLAFSGLALMLPQTILWLSGILRVVARRGLSTEGFLAVDNIVKFPARTALTVIAFAGSLSIIVSMWGLLGSFESSIGRWLHTIFPFDLTVQLNDLSGGIYSSASFHESVLVEVADDPRVAETYGARAIFTAFRRVGPRDDGADDRPTKARKVLLVAIDHASFNRLRIERGLIERTERTDREAAGVAAGGVLVSENLSNIFGVEEGDEIDLPTVEGTGRFPVVGVVEDFSWPRGTIFLDRSIYRERWQDEAITFLDVCLVDQGDAEAVRVDLARQFAGRYNVFIHRTDEMRAQSLKLVRDWFRLADVLIVLAVVIGGMGVVNTLLISVISQSRQLGLLRAVGASEGQIKKSLAIEAACLGILSGILGTAIGLFVVKFPMSAMTAAESGYAMPFVFPTRAVALALGGGLVIALLASTVPIRFTRRIDILDAIGYE